MVPKKEYSYRKFEGYSEIDTIFVLEEHRKKGAGSKLIKKFFEWSKEMKAQRAKVNASIQNTKAINFYKQNGFKEYTLCLEKEIK